MLGPKGMQIMLVTITVRSSKANAGRTCRANDHGAQSLLGAELAVLDFARQNTRSILEYGV